LYLKYYTYDGTSWSGPTTLYSDSTVSFPSAFVDSSGRVWVAFYVPTGSFSSFNIYSWGLRLMYYDGSWHGPYTIDDYVANSYPPALSEFRGKIWIAYSEASYYGGNSPKYNDRWPYSRYSIKVVAFDPSTETVTEERYISPGTSTNFHVDGDNDAHEGIYYSYTTEYDTLNNEIMVTSYTGNSYRFVWPTPMNNTRTDYDWVPINVITEYPVDGITVDVNGPSGSSYSMVPQAGGWYYNVTNLSDGSYTYSITLQAIGESMESAIRTFIVDTTTPTYVDSTINGDPNDWPGDESIVPPDSSQVVDGILVWKDAVDSSIYNATLVKVRADGNYVYLLIDVSEIEPTATSPNAYIEVLFDSDNDGTYDYSAVFDLSQYNLKDGEVRKLNLFNLNTGQNIGDSNTLGVASATYNAIELQIPRSLIGNPQGNMRLSVKVYDTQGAGLISGPIDVVTDSGNDYTVLDIAAVPTFSNVGLVAMLSLLLIYLLRRR